MNKDYFSKQSRAYAAFRPQYPEDLYRFIYQHLGNSSCAWDCATGNGQVAIQLAAHFKSVFATDISQQQLDNAFSASNITYSLAPAEHTTFADHQFDLITVGQALHWFDLPAFYKEVRRTCATGGLLAVWGYSSPSIEPAIDEAFVDFYDHTVGPYWDNARRLVENHYRDIPFPFDEIQSPPFSIKVMWSLDRFLGYLSSWSATQHYIADKHEDPVVRLGSSLKARWRSGVEKQVVFPVFLRLGRVSK